MVEVKVYNADGFDPLLYLKMQQPISIWLDCDPGLDDALAMILAARHQKLNLIGVSTSAGNTSIDSTTRNALDILYSLKRQDVQVIRGSQVLIAGQPHLAEHMHGSGGLGGVKLETSPKSAITQNPFQAIRDILMKQQGQIVWTNTGATTNLCWLFRKFPQVKAKISKIVMMGGAIGVGNISPAAEFNVFFDPQSLKEVIQSKGDIPLVMVPLELTHEVRAKEPIFKFLQSFSQFPLALALLQMLRVYKEMYYKAYKFDSPPVHDPCVMYYLINPEAFTLQKANIIVDTYPVSYGRTNFYFKDPQNPTKPIQSVDIVATKMSKKSQFWGYFESILKQIFAEENK